MYKGPEGGEAFSNVRRWTNIIVKRLKELFD